jgi:hypothetical protein
LLKDKHGRIYFDYELEWFEPLLNCVRDGRAIFNVPVDSVAYQSVRKILSDLKLQYHIDVVGGSSGYIKFSSPCPINQLQNVNIFHNLENAVH